MPNCAKKFTYQQIAILMYSNIVIFFDFLIFMYLADALNTAFLPATNNPLIAKLQIFGIFILGYLARPVGGLIIGRYGDIKGRKSAFMLTSISIVIISLVMACLPTYAQIGMVAPILLIIVRFAQGMVFGAHSVLGWVYISEHVPKHKIGFYTSLVSASFCVSVLIALFIFKGMLGVFSLEAINSYVWRLVFIACALLGLIAIGLGRYLQETPMFMKNRSEESYIPNYTDLVLNYERFHAIVLTVLLSFYAASLVVVIVLLLPKLVQISFSVDASVLMLSNVLGIIGFIVGTLFYGKLADKGHVGKLLMIGSVLLATQAFVFYYALDYSNAKYLIPMYILLGFSAGVISLCPIVFLQLFATGGRLTSIAVIYNTVHGLVGSLLPIGLIYATQYISFAPALYLIFVGITGFITGLYVYRVPNYGTYRVVLFNQLKLRQLEASLNSQPNILRRFKLDT